MAQNRFAYQSSRRRPGRAFSAPKRHSRKNAKQLIDPARFVKDAEPNLNSDYQTTNEFADFAMHPLLKANITAKGIANTGTGKTAAFALPILNKLMRAPDSQALIIAPTRELAIQIEQQCQLLAKSSGLHGALLIGGNPMGKQISDLKRRPRMIIGTPGRIKDHLRQGTLNLGRCDMVVLDEVDRMLDMGFINDVRDILSNLPPQHQAFFFSATLSPEIRSLIETFAADPVVVNVKIGETSQNVHQDVINFHGNTQKMDLLHDLLISESVTKTLVFGKTKHGVERLGKELKARGFKADALHGGKSQGQRKRALDAFRENKITVLVATDVAARGIDVKDISHVINYEQPQTYDDYVHRIGRAGRAGQAGYALTFVEKI
jgi:superfamily II DNA/RNA helicase